MFKDFMPTIHRAADELSLGLENVDQKQVKETYNLLIALNIEFYSSYLKHYTQHLMLDKDKQVEQTEDELRKGLNL